MTFQRDKLPDPLSYFEAAGLTLKGRGKWRTTSCEFHGGATTMRINTDTGAFVCMAACGARGGDVLAYHQARHGLQFVDAAKALGAWADGDEPQRHYKPTPLSARDALTVLTREVTLAAVAAANLANEVVLTATDRHRLLKAAGRINAIKEYFP